QGAEADPGVARIGEAADDELALLHAFDLQPVGRASTPIRRTAALRHDPFEAELTHLVEQRFAPALEVLHVTNRTAVPQEPAARYVANAYSSFRKQPDPSASSETSSPSSRA